MLYTYSKYKTHSFSLEKTENIVRYTSCADKQILCTIISINPIFETQNKPKFCIQENVIKIPGSIDNIYSSKNFDFSNSKYQNFASYTDENITLIRSKLSYDLANTLETLIASKVILDVSVSNYSWSIYSQLSLCKINMLERQILTNLNYDVYFTLEIHKKIANIVKNFDVQENVIEQKIDTFKYTKK